MPDVTKTDVQTAVATDGGTTPVAVPAAKRRSPAACGATPGTTSGTAGSSGSRRC